MMKLFGRVAIGLLWMVCSLPVRAGIVWIAGDHGEAGPLPDSAQAITTDGNNDSLDFIFGNLIDRNNANMFRILITDLTNFSAEVTPDAVTDPGTQVIPQIFLFDIFGVPIVGAYGAFLGDSILPFGPDPAIYGAGYYYLMVDSVGHDPISTVTGQALFCTGTGLFPADWQPCLDTANPKIDGYQGEGVNPGTYVITLNGVTADSPEPGSVVFMLSGLAAVLALARKKRPSAGGGSAS
jgi:hypothetical protein